MLSAASPIAEGAFEGGLSIVCMFDQPTAAMIATRESLDKLGLSANEAITIGKANVERELGSLPTNVDTLPPGGIAPAPSRSGRQA